MSGHLWDFFVDRMIILFMPLVCSYFAFSGDIVINVAASNATGLEKIGNQILIPVHYLFAGQEAFYHPPKAGDMEAAWEFQQRFSYQEGFWIKTAASIAALPPSLLLGTGVKLLSLLFQEPQKRYRSLLSAKNNTKTMSNIDSYRKLGLEIAKSNEYQWLENEKYLRRPGDERHLASAKEALAQIAKAFNEAGIPWWVDCGTCLGAYRYGGVIPWDGDVDVAVLLPDFENVRRALNHLDSNKYQVQNWSGRSTPNSYFKIFVKQTSSTIDIGFFEIFPEKQQIQCIFALEDSLFFPEWVKIRERRFSVPASFSMVFPLRKAVFDGVEVFVPNRTKEYLQRCYGENLAPAKIYDPRTKRFEPDLSHPYWQREFVH